MNSGNRKAMPLSARWSSGTASATKNASTSAAFIPTAACVAQRVASNRSAPVPTAEP